MNWPYAYQSAHALLKKLRNREISSVDLVEQSIRRIEAYDPEINAVVTRDFASAREAAVKADEALARREKGALLGLPITVKESYSVCALSKSWAVPGYENNIESYDGVVASRLKRAGAIVLGKTNVPTYLGDWQTYNDIYGVTKNPWDVSLTVGGSSGGSAAALACGYVSLEFGSDLSGSLRVPAHCCGIYAHNPSYGLVPQRGHEPPGIAQLSVGRGKDFAVNGPLARCADDLALALQVVAGPDDDMATAYRLDLPRSRHNRLEDFRVLLLTQHPLSPSSHDVIAALEDCAEHLVRRGCVVERSANNYLDLAAITQVFLQQVMALISIDLGDGEYQLIQEKVSRLSPSDQNLDALVLRGQVLSYRDFARLNRQRTIFKHQWRELFNKFDVVLCPVMPIPAFAHDHTTNQNARTLMVDDQPISYEEIGLWSALATLTGQPCTTMPIAHSTQGLPIGMQIIGPFLEDLTTIGFASCLEREFGGFKPPPAFI